MVTFKLVSKTETSIIYNYYPEGRETQEFGIICIDLLNDTIILEKLAANDFERVIKKEELNEMREAINKMRLENGESELSEDDLPTATEDEVSRFYADHAINAIWKAYKKGTPLKSGSRAWY